MNYLKIEQISTLTKHILLFSFLGILLFPLYWMFIGSLQSIVGIMKVPPSFFPLNPTLKNYISLIRGSSFLLWMFNTVMVVVPMVLLSVITCSLAGFAFAVYRLDLLFGIFLISLMIPRTVMIVPLFGICSKLGISSSRLGAILPVSFSMMGIILMRNFVKSVPKSFLEAAWIDGAGDWTLLWRIILPIAKPVLGVIMILQSLAGLTDFLWQSLILRSSDQYTILIGVITQVYRTYNPILRINPIGVSLAGGMILFLPLFLIFLSFRKMFVGGIITGSVKG